MSPAPLPNGTQIGMSFEMGVDINVGTEAVPVWLPIRRPTAIDPNVTPKLVDVQTYDDNGADNQDRISESFVLAFGLQVNRNMTTGLYLPEAEKLKSYTEPAAIGALAVAQVRWYDKPAAGAANPNDAYMGYCTVGLTRASGNADVGSWSVTLTGKGARTQIANPYALVVPAAPTVTAATPSGAAVGAQVVVSGTGFIGTTGIKFLAVTAPVFSVISSATLVVTVPAGVAGSAPITVTNSVGASNVFPYTRA
ncbi:MAG: phage tail tube protein [Rhodoglobus sp.]